MLKCGCDLFMKGLCSEIYVTFGEMAGYINLINF